ncbi:S-adenosyl-L-methionine-dependent methyltransferase, partial [Lineolata rhizophorae]
SSLTSLASEVTRGVVENGRRYHSFGNAEYAFPNDDRELDRLDMQHAMQTLLLDNKLFWAPIGSDVQQVLDLGTGTGIWAIDFAEMFPQAEVIGTDLSAIQPSWVPPNCRFQIDDAEQDWTFKPAQFDYIHNRNFVCSIRDWPRLIRQSFSHVRPGGWVEWQEKHPLFLSDDDSLPADGALDTWGRTFFDAGVTFGTSPYSPQHLADQMREAGFVDVREHVLKLPVGPWPKDKRLKHVGMFEMVNMVEGVEALSMRLFTRALGWSPERVQLLLERVRKEAKDRKVHSYYHL